MSEYQYYEFAAVERPLTRQEMAELREISTRATITSTRFQNEYHWGDLKADPDKLLERYFDAHLYYANWGCQTVKFRLPEAAVEVEALRHWFNGEYADLRSSEGWVVLGVCPYDEEPPEDWIEASLGDLLPLRSALMEGDLTFAYLAWLTCAVYEGYDDDDDEPPVPSALAKPSTAVHAFADLMFIDRDLITAVSEGAPVVENEPERIREWVAGLSLEEKDRWLHRAADNPRAPLGAELTGAWRRTHATSGQSTRKVKELFKRAEEIREQRRREQARKQEQARIHAEAKRKEHLEDLASDLESAWVSLDRHLSSGDYDKAAALAVDLHEVYAERMEEFTALFRVVRQRYKKKTAFARRLPKELKAIK